MFFGEWFDVSYETIKTLAEKGTDIIFIEKRDIVRALGKFAEKIGIALVNSHGHLTEYAKDLAEFAKESGAHLAIMTDYDIPGIHIASKLNGVVWLGVDERMLEHFEISHENKQLVVGYHPQRRLLKSTIDEILEDDRFSHIDREFLKRNKIEIDAVLATQGAESLWDYMIDLLGKEHPNRDYTRVINTHKSYSAVPATVGYTNPPIVGKIESYLSDRVTSLTEETRDSLSARTRRL